MSGDSTEPRSSELACPRCGASMVRRKRRVDRAEFWGCPRFPRCKGTRPLEAIDQVRPSDPGAVIEHAVPWNDDSWRRHSAPGASARAAFERRDARHRAKTRRKVPIILLRGVAFVVVGLALAGLPGTWPLAGWGLVGVGVLSTAVLLWVAPSHVTAWTTGASGEERVGPLLETLQSKGWYVLHDRRVPGARENIDHIAIGPAGVVVVETKSYKGDVRMRDGVLRINGRRVDFFAQVERQIAAIEQAIESDKVIGIITVLRADFPWRSRPQSGRVRVVPLSELLVSVTAGPHVLSGEDIQATARLAELRLLPARA